MNRRFRPSTDRIRSSILRPPIRLPASWERSLIPTGSLARSDTNNFAPRIGMAWTFRPKWVFRGSFGIIHSDIFATTQNIMFDEYLATATVAQPTGNPNYAFKLADGPTPFKYNVQSNGSVPFIGSNYSTRNASWWDPNMRMPYVINWSGGLQYEFARNWLVETLYQGQSGVGLVNSWDANAIPLNISSNATTLNQIFTATQNYKPYTQFGAVNLYSNFSHNSHHAGTVWSTPLTSTAFNAFYSYSKTLTDASGEGGTSGITYYNRALEKGRTDYDIRHHFVSVMTYELPFGKGRRWMTRGGVADQVFGGWMLAWTQTLQSGQPFSGDLLGKSEPAICPALHEPKHRDLRRRMPTTPDWGIGPNRFPTSAQVPYLNIGSFAYPAAFTPGTLGRNAFKVRE